MADTVHQPPSEAGSKRGEAVRLERVSHDYNGKPAIADVSLVVPDGEFCVLIGPSGCGKTTCLDVIAGELTPASGNVAVLGEKPARGNRRIAYMFARDALFPWRTARDNVALALEGRKVPRPERNRRAVELLDAVGLADSYNAYPAQLSQGMRQRVALARTFAVGAEVLLMDEPFAALDAQTRLVLEQELLGLWQRQASTVLFVTHDLAEAILLADRIAVFSPSPGRIARIIPVPLSRPRSLSALQAQPQFRELYEELWGELEDGARNSRR